MKHIQRDFHSDAWVMPKWCDLGAPGCPEVGFFFEHGHVAYEIDGDGEQNRMQVKYMYSP